MTVDELRGTEVMMAVSGGLDSCTITHWLSQQGVQVLAYTADLGQPDEERMEDVRERMLACGAQEMIVADLKEDIARVGIQLIQAMARYEGGYWNTTGIARHVVVAGMVPEMRHRGVTVLGHGATGRGNDQVRFQLAAQMLDPDIRVYAPWRDAAFLAAFGGRKEMIEYCNSHDLPIRATHEAPYSTDSNILGLTHEAGELESLATPASRVTAEMGVFPDRGPDQTQVFEIRFEQGIPVRLDARPVDPFEAISLCNETGGRHGIGIGLHAVENRFVGIKSRGVYEAPGLELLGSCYAYLLQLVLDRRTRRIYDQMSTIIAEQIYQGYWFDTATQACWRFVEHLNQLATGTITVDLYKGNIAFRSAKDVPHTLYSESTSSMEDVGEFDHRDSEGLLGVLGVGARALNRAGQTGL
ncbi:MAG TPA: argininosuccinate synthase [Candidatus Latescibacteria bacterium]|nr:argininosuccinate synthase [Candidatus Latescibacterota bacterium]HIM55336.1 argininosuccinate synthase [Candidatus Latescibacterota bacterium]